MREIEYIKLNDFKKEENIDFSIIGELDIREENDEIEVKSIVINNEIITYAPIGSYNEKDYTLIGYLDCGNNEYILVKKKKNKFIIFLLWFFVILMLLFGGFYLYNYNRLGIDPNISDYNGNLKRPADMDSRQLLIPGYGNMYIKKGTQYIDTSLFNPDGNPVYFKFTLIDQNTQEVLYKTQLIPPGKGIQPIKINKIYNEVGEYPLLLKIETVDFEDFSLTYNGANSNVTLHVIE